ncbi:hypothetical protein BC835DRAFT_1400726, partial [Cytidiella melzeri]
MPGNGVYCFGRDPFVGKPTHSRVEATITFSLSTSNFLMPAGNKAVVRASEGSPFRNSSTTNPVPLRPAAFWPRRTLYRFNGRQTSLQRHLGLVLVATGSGGFADGSGVSSAFPIRDTCHGNSLPTPSGAFRIQGFLSVSPRYKFLMNCVVLVNPVDMESYGNVEYVSTGRKLALWLQALEVVSKVHAAASGARTSWCDWESTSGERASVTSNARIC